MSRGNAYKIAYRAILVAAALVLSWVESQFSAFIPFPGMKIGLANLVVLVALYRLGAADALIMNIIRIILSSLLFGNMFALFYSIAGGFLSWIVMVAAKKTEKCGVVGVSVLGGVAHNVGQIIVAIILLGTSQLIFYLPVLIIGGIAAGVAIGIVGGILVKRLPREGKGESEA